MDGKGESEGYFQSKCTKNRNKIPLYSFFGVALGYLL